MNTVLNNIIKVSYFEGCVILLMKKIVCFNRI